MSVHGLTVAVIGGGVGGLCAALCFAKRGARVLVYERALELAEVGAGIQVSENGMRVLRALDLQTRARDLSFASKGLTLNNAHGRRVTILPNGPTRETRLFHRADLVELLSEACAEADVEILFGQRITPDNRPDADVVIAADGVKSHFRSWVTGDDRAAAFTGQVAWRALVPTPELIKEGGVNLYMGPGQHIVVYPLRNGTLLNIVAVEETDDWHDEGWSQPASAADLQSCFAGFRGTVENLLPHVTEVYRWGLFAHRVPPVWYHENVVLLGDAAHAMLPFLAQGAVMAIEDAWVLASSIDAHGLKDGLQAYSTTRAPRVERVMKEAAANAHRFHIRNPVAAHAAQFGLGMAGRLAPGVFHKRYSWLYDHDVTR
ncbi:MAG: FAD-dependent monooxygenase [Pseudomonadota bacterium]